VKRIAVFKFHLLGYLRRKNENKIVSDRLFLVDLCVPFSWAVDPKYFDSQGGHHPMSEQVAEIMTG
jgi:hypothetical protein